MRSAPATDPLPNDHDGLAEALDGTARSIALIGNPNTGKTTLFNRISGLRHKTSNFPGTTLEARVTRVRAGIEGGRDGDLIDLPGIYSLELEQTESRIAREVLAGQTAPRGEPLGAPEVVVVVCDATNLARNLMLVGEVVRRRLPTLVVINMIDLARRKGLAIDTARLCAALGCGVVLASARTGEGIDQVRIGIRNAKIPAPVIPVPGAEGGGGGAGAAHADDAMLRWAEEVASRALARSSETCTKCGYSLAGLATSGKCPECAEPYTDLRQAPATATQTDEDNLTDRLDRAFTHPLIGIAVFALISTGLFYMLFALAAYPMDWIEKIFGGLTALIEGYLPDGVLRDLLANGIVGGIGATLVFLPQICLLFFLISLLEDTGYLARAAFVMDRVLRPFGLNGHAFVPLLSSHACALPGIMATRSIPDRRERLATILVAPFMTCSARLPVYSLIVTLLFPHRPYVAAIAFVGCYALGIFAAVFSSLLARRTILRGRGRPMVLELPTYKLPSLRTALITTYDRGMVFLKNAGTNILMICICLWWLSSYPKAEPPAQAVELRRQIEGHVDDDPYLPPQSGDHAWSSVGDVRAAADRLEARHQAANSYAGRFGRFIQPVFAPLGYDWQLTIGVLTSFAAREVFVSTLAVVVAGQQDSEAEGVFEQIATATRDDGVTPVFTPAVCWSLLVYYVLAMQCLPTLAVTARESGSWKWAVLQQVWMSGVAYVLALIVFQLLK